jgi:hypothetical protein
MRIIKFIYDNGYVGGHIEECYIFPSDYTDSQIDGLAYEDFCQFCEDYAYLAHGYPWIVEDGGYYDTEEEAAEDEESYYLDCGYGWDEITIDELKEWCEEHYGDFESRYEPQIKEMLEKEGK